MGLPQIYEGNPISVPKFHFIALSGISNCRGGINPSPTGSLSKNFQYAPVSGIIKETGVLLWNNGEKTQEVKQLSWI